MRALILAAGFGTRLKPITDKIPKALVKIKGKTLIERSILYLQKHGIKEILINTHHLAEQIENFLKDNNFNIPINTIFEPKILDTGGAIKNTQNFFQNSMSFVVYNVDVVTDLNLKRAIDFHKKNKNLATLLVKTRQTKRPFIIDKTGLLVGHKDKGNFLNKGREVGFLGIHILSPKIFDLMPKENKFGITQFYLDLIKTGLKINTFEVQNCYWADAGSLDRIKEIQVGLSRFVSCHSRPEPSGRESKNI
ncbi:MAG: sugar phosphate nucleotidyltransferase [Patescibacteria group bacterium]